MSVLEKQRFFREIYVRGRGGRKAFRAGRCGFCMEQSTEYLRQLLQEYKKQALPFLRYLPYFEKNAGAEAALLSSVNSVLSVSVMWSLFK